MKKQKNKIHMLIAIPHLISVNNYTKGSGKGKRCLTPEAAMEKQNIRSSLRNAGLCNNCYNDNSKWYQLSINYYLATNFSRRDTDNLNKIVIDGITDFLGFDDSRIINVNSTKYKLLHSKASQCEYVEFVLEEIDIQNIYCIERKLLDNKISNGG